MEYREFLIPKKNGKPRKIVAPDEELLAYQRSKLNKLVSIYKDVAEDHGVESVAHGFLPNRGCTSAARLHVGYEATIMMDISNFFDSVTRDMIRPFSKQMANDNKLYHKEGYCGQGFATSPILANIAITPALAKIQEYLEDWHSDSVITIFADDIQISVNDIGEDYDVVNSIIEYVTDVVQEEGFEIKPTKTRVMYSKYGYRKILGINVGEDHIRATRKTMRKIRAARHQGNHSSLGGLVNWSNCNLPKNYS